MPELKIFCCLRRQGVPHSALLAPPILVSWAALPGLSQLNARFHDDALASGTRTASKCVLTMWEAVESTLLPTSELLTSDTGQI